MAGTEARIDLDAIAHNVALIRAHRRTEVMAVVKADGYGHGLVPSARAALAGGATWLGVALPEEALALRRAGVRAPLLCWLLTPGDDLAAAVAAGVDLSASARSTLDDLARAARATGRVARVHLKVDTGCGRGGAARVDWAELVLAASKLADEIEVVGVWSHLANADVPGHPGTPAQLDAFAEALEVAAGLGVVPQLRHLANSAGALAVPRAAYDLVRPGIAVFGVDPIPGGSGLDLVPAMTLRASVALTKRVPAGTGVSYGHDHVTARETTLALVAAGYADGVPRSASGGGVLQLGGRRHRVAGRVCMDQFVVDVGDQPVAIGDEVLLFGPGHHGEPTAAELAHAVGTIPNEIVCRIGPRVPRVYTGTAVTSSVAGDRDRASTTAAHVAG